MRERRQSRALSRALFGIERQAVMRELVELMQRTLRRRRVERP